MSKSDNRKTESASSRPARLRILDKEVQIACKPGEEDDLMQAAAYIDQSMRDLRQRSKTSSIEKIAIVTAINTANALLKSRSQEGSDNAVSERLASLNEKLDELLAEPFEAETAADTIMDSSTDNTADTKTGTSSTD